MAMIETEMVSRVKEINDMLNQHSFEHQPVDPFKGRALLRSSQRRTEESASPKYAEISVQYDYLNPNQALPPTKNTTAPRAKTADADEPSNQRNSIPKGRHILPRSPIKRQLSKEAKKSPRIPEAYFEDTRDERMIFPQTVEEEKPRKNYIPKGNVLARTPPSNQRRTSIDMVLPNNDDDIFRRPIRPPVMRTSEERKSNALQQEQLRIDLQKRIENAIHKVDTGLQTKPKPTPKKVMPKKKHKAVQVSLLDDKAKTPKNVSKGINTTKSKLPLIDENNKINKTLKRSNSVQNLDDITVEEFVLEMVSLAISKANISKLFVLENGEKERWTSRSQRDTNEASLEIHP